MKILVVHVPAGAGHQRAAEAIGASFHDRRSSAEIIVWDALMGTNALYRWSFTKGYLRLIQQAPFLWGLAYHLTDIKTFSGIVGWIHRMSNRLHGNYFEKYLMETNPDVVIGTHFFPMEVAGRLKSEGKIRARLITVVTDYMPHALWMTPGIDAYVVASPQAKEELIVRRVPAEKIHLLGIPVDPKFQSDGNRPELIQRLGLDQKKFTVLIGSGGAGTGPIVSLVNSLAALSDSLQLLIVVGKNDSLFRKLESLRPSVKHMMRIYGFVNNMDELMGVSDLVISKAGGLTCTEALVKGVPLVLVAPIPGQETRNAEIITQLGAALWAKSVPEIPRIIQQLRNDPEILLKMRQKAREHGLPHAAEQITKLVVP